MESAASDGEEWPVSCATLRMTRHKSLSDNVPCECLFWCHFSPQWLQSCAFQARRASVQVTTRLAAVLPGGGLPTRCCHRTSPTAFVGHRHVSSSANQHTVRWSLVCRCGASNMEQSANPLARLWTITRTIQAITKDTSLQAYIQLLTTAAPSDSVFRALGTNWLTYLLTYLTALLKSPLTVLLFGALFCVCALLVLFLACFIYILLFSGLLVEL